MSSRTRPLVVGLLGGIGSGKSAIARGVAARFRSLLIDADRVGHEVLTIPRVKDRIRARLGADVFDGEDVSRPALARRIFGADHVQQQAREALHAIVHPEIGDLISERIRQVAGNQEAGGLDLVVLDAAVLLEAGWREQCDLLVFVDVPLEIRQDRACSRGWADDELQRREACQWPLDRKRSLADFVVDNAAAADVAVDQVVEFVKSRLSAR